jgi:hypothetical protein
MIEDTTYLNCRPSQILNLRYFLLTLILAPLFFLLKEPVIQQIPSGFIPGKLLIHIHRFPVYVTMVLIFNMGNLVVYTSDKTTPEFRLEAVRDVEDIYKVLRGLVELNRREKHVFEID